MNTPEYLLEKACFVSSGLACLAETLRAAHLESRRVEDHLCVAVRSSLELCATVRGVQVEPHWVLGLVREGSPYWKTTCRPQLCPDELAPPADDVDDAALDRLAVRNVAALLDLADATLAAELPPRAQSRLRVHLAWCLGAATKVVASRAEAEWSPRWADRLASEGRAALPEVVAALSASCEAPLDSAAFAPLNEAWLFAADPDRSAAAERRAERRRRRRLDPDRLLPGDLVFPKRYRGLTVRRIERSGLPQHRVCVDFAEDPQGALVLAGGPRSGVRATAWAIARHWFVEELRDVRPLSWIELVSDNLHAQNLDNWSVERALIHDLLPVELDDGRPADPGYADRLLAYRLRRRLPTVIALEETTLASLRLRPTTRALLQSARWLDLPNLTQGQLDATRIPI